MKPLSRTAYLLSALMLAAVAIALPIRAHAQAEPTYQSQIIGNYSVTALSDGNIYTQRKDLSGLPDRQLADLLQNGGVMETPQGIKTSVNAYLVRRGTQSVLIDTGAADCFAAKNDELGRLPDNMRRAGLSADRITHILLTHAHPDHVCGLLAPNGQAAYPQATVWISQSELDYWQSDSEKMRQPEAMRFLFDRARAALKPYQEAGRLRTFTENTPLPLEAEAISAPGHTAGHYAFLFGRNSRQPLLVWGDIIHFASVQFAHPEAVYAYDSNTRQGLESRRRLLEQAAEHHWTIAGAHLPFPGIGQVMRISGQADAYRWLAAQKGGDNTSRPHKDKNTSLPTCVPSCLRNRTQSP